MRKFFFFFAACLMLCTSQQARAYEYIFDFAVNDADNVYNRLINSTDPANVFYTIKDANGNDLVELRVTAPDKVQAKDVVVDPNKGKLYIPDGSRLRIRLLDGHKLRQVQFGKFEKATGSGYCGQLFGPGVTHNELKDVTGILDGTTDEHVFVYGMSAGNVSSFTSTTIWPPTIHENGGCYLGSKVKVYSEGISLEDLNYAEGNVRLQKHKIDHDLVGVSVKTINGSKYLVARSAEQLENHRQVMKDGQESFKDDNGNVYPWSDPNTPQYTWVLIDMNGKNNPDDFVGKKFGGVRGTYCKYDQAPEGEWIFWENPCIILDEALNLSAAVDEPTASEINTYPLANFVLPKDDSHFLLKPTLCEMCNVVDVMRSHGDHFIYVPDENAIMPEMKTTDAQGHEIIVASPNFYTDNDLVYGRNYSYASFINNQAEAEAYYDSDVELLDGNTYLNWRLYDKVYDFPKSLVVAATHANTAEYVYPLSIPNQEHTETTDGMVLHIIGKGELRNYNTDMYVGNSDYWSRYKYGVNRNAYRNDLFFSLSNPQVKNMGTLSVWRCNDKGEKLVKIGEVKQQDQWNLNNFYLTSFDAAKEAKDEPLLQNLGKDPYFPNNQLYQLGQSQAGGQGKVTMMYMTDMFYSETMCDATENASLSNDYAYRLEATVDGVTSVVGFAPVFKTEKNSVSRATYTKDQVDGDEDGALAEVKKANITFTPNMAKAMTEYRVYKAEQGATSVDAPYNVVDAGSIEVDDYGFLNPTFTDDITDKTYEYVPEVYTAYNNNTYGCYKQIVSDATIYLKIENIVAADVAEDGKMPCLATLTIRSSVDMPAKDTRYLVRVWREVNGVKTLLNGQKEIGGYTNYAALATLAEQDGDVTITDVFRVAPVSTVGLMAEGQTVNIPDVKYYATLYVEDVASNKYYVKKIDAIKNGNNIPTAINGITTGAQVESVRYYNVAGIESEKPFAGMNIVVTRYSDGTTTTAKVVK